MPRLPYKFVCSLLMAGILLTACQEEQGPTSLIPAVSVEEAQEVTRTTATLTGKVESRGEEKVTVVRFRYGTSTEMEQAESCDAQSALPTVTLTLLKPNTTYYYCLEAGNGYSTVQSTPLHFTTLPNRAPVLHDLQRIGQGPLSITLQCELADDGGEPVTTSGFYYRAENGEEQKWPVDPKHPTLQARISGLQAMTTYTVQAYAGNSIGETRSEKITFQTGQAVIVTQPGTLSETIDEQEKYLYNALNIAGPLNGTDLRYLREMLGKNVYGNQTPGAISHLNLADASICPGGASYDGMRFTEQDLISYGMFAHCDYLEKLILPDDTQRIEENAFKGCPNLTLVQIPATASQIQPSDSCRSLTTLEVAANNPTYTSIDGVLYNKACTRLVWFPEGQEELSLPATIEGIEAYALRNCRIRSLQLPPTVKEIGKGAFHRALLEEIVLPDGLELIPNGLFQECSRLTSLTLGKQANYLADYCFDGCPLRQLYVRSEEFPPMCHEHTFGEELWENCTLYVPEGCLKMYRNASYWGKFKEIRTFTPSE